VNFVSYFIKTMTSIRIENYVLGFKGKVINMLRTVGWQYWVSRTVKQQD
jgi:predicted negative regulator of RcsB-dependent stress response